MPRSELGLSFLGLQGRLSGEEQGLQGPFTPAHKLQPWAQWAVKGSVFPRALSLLSHLVSDTQCVACSGEEGTGLALEGQAGSSEPHRKSCLPPEMLEHGQDPGQ